MFHFCNFKCRHCLVSAPDAHHPQLPLSDCLHIVDEIASCGINRVDITGGEPLVRNDFEEIVKALSKYGIDIGVMFTNASLDFVTAMVLASTYGVGMALAAVVLFLWQGSIYGLTLLAGNVITDSMMAELSIVGGFLIAMSGLSIMKVKDFKALNFLPALIVPVAWCLIRG